MYWDLRDAFLFCLYRGSVEVARLDSVLPHIDTVRYRNLCTCMSVYENSHENCIA